jgi:primosomal protein N' (replication factor Y)
VGDQHASDDVQTVLRRSVTQTVQVAPFLPVRGLYSYSYQANAAEIVGCRVLTTFGGRKILGVVVPKQADGDGAPSRLSPIIEVLDSAPLFSTELLDFLLWTARYYLAPEGEVIRAALPPSLCSRQPERLRLTKRGQEILSAQSQVLRRTDQHLSAPQSELLAALARGPKASARLGAARKRIVGEAIERGWVERFLDLPSESPSKELVVRRLESADWQTQLERSPKQATLWHALPSDERPWRELRQLPKDGRRLLRALVQKGLAATREVDRVRDPFEDAALPDDPRHDLTSEQQTALETMRQALSEQRFAPFLLHGVTGSGKTEVYLRLIAAALERGLSALVLVPEIALTPQLAGRFRARFGARVAVLHSGLSQLERVDQWREIRAGRRPIVVGARSAIFAPIAKLGVLVVDEEHDSSFKQEDGVRYNARDLALVRGQLQSAVVVLGSATPSLESHRASELGRISRLRLLKRATARPLPAVDIVDMRVHRPGLHGVLTEPLCAAIDDALAGDGQVILFLNRRGYSPHVSCSSCGHAFRCQHCAVSLTHHRRRSMLVCHHCGYCEPLPERCSQCSSSQIRLRGFGTERVEAVLAERFPRARVARLDRDTAADLQGLLERMHRRETDVLIGTQMVTKGHDFPHVVLVGVLNADHGLHFPDFRASERAFQLLTQVAGRAGRSARAGRVVIQTYAPDHLSITSARRHDYARFVDGEAASRQQLGYPPFGYMVALHLDGEEAAAVEQSAGRLAGRLRQLGPPDVTLLGPAEAPLNRLKDRVRWMVLARCPTRGPVRSIARLALEMERELATSGARLVVDIDPQQLL